MPTTTKKSSIPTTLGGPSPAAGSPVPAGETSPQGAAAPAGNPTTVTSTSTPATAVSRRDMQSKAAIVTALLALASELQKTYGPTESIVLSSGTYTITAIVAAINAFVAAIANVTATSRAYHSAVLAERALSTSTLALRSQLKMIIQARVGKTSPEMTAYGFVPAKVPVHSVKAKATAIAKTEATREARGTKGPVAKLAVTGNVTGVEITPVTSEGAQATSPAVPGAAAPSTPAKS